LLAVFGVEYERNRDYLLEVLHRCRAKQNSDCDDDTADLAIGLFERGHHEMLHPLMLIAPESDAGLSETLGTFYSDALTQQPRTFVDEISQLPASGQKAVCRLAGSTDGGGMASDVLNKARRKLRAIGGSVALQCLRQVEIGAKSDQSGAT
jgi:hypothetical protein